MPIVSETKPALAFAIVGSHTTAISAELAAAAAGYERVMAIVRRGATTALPVAMDGDAWAKRLKRLGIFGAEKEINAFLDHLTEMAGGEPFDCLIHHSTDPFSQLLSGHPLCRKYFYIEEGFTALIGGKFGRPKKRSLKRNLWNLKSRWLYGGRINRYRNFFDLDDEKFGGVFALSKAAFKGFPKRIQLQADLVSTHLPPPAAVVIFLDSQYLLGNCSAEDYTAALLECLKSVLTERSSVAIKFHPGEKDSARKSRMMEAVRGLENVENLTELSAGFVGERMTFDPSIKVIVGTSALGFYLGDRGFSTFTFAPRLVADSVRFAKVMAQIPEEFIKVCQSA